MKMNFHPCWRVWWSVLFNISSGRTCWLNLGGNLGELDRAMHQLKMSKPRNQGDEIRSNIIVGTLAVSIQWCPLPWSSRSTLVLHFFIMLITKPGGQHGFRWGKPIEEQFLTANTFLDKTSAGCIPTWVVVNVHLSTAFDRVHYPMFSTSLLEQQKKRTHGMDDSEVLRRTFGWGNWIIRATKNFSIT